MFCDCSRTLAINAIAHGDGHKVQEIATLKSMGRSWTDGESQWT